MKFRTKLIAGFSVVVFLISAFLGIACYWYNSRKLTDMSKQTLSFYSRQLASGIDTTVDEMKNVTDYILSDPDMLYAIQSLPGYHNSGSETEIKEQLDVLTSGLSLYYIYRDFYRVVFFNELGSVAASTNAGAKIVDKSRYVYDISWLSDAADAKGKPILVGPHEDGWGLRSSEEVFSLARKVQGGNFGYIEVENETSKLKDIFAVADSNVQVIAWLPDGEILYKSADFSDELLDYAQKNKDGSISDVTVGKEYGYVASSASSENGIRVAVLLETSGIVADMLQALWLAVAVALACFGISEGVVILIANTLSKPLVLLKEQMENTGIENLDAEPEVLGTDDEMKAVSIAYQNLLRRLNESMIKEQRLSVLELQAQFDTLQAQVNPHFLYNVLNVISSRGIIDEDEEICEICGSLAAMLRYSSNNKQRYVSVREEFTYLEKYIYLLKSRYEHRLEVETMCSPAILDEVLPKIVVQQLVENSIQHGFKGIDTIMKIRVTGWRDEKGWYIRVQDNGTGITPEAENEVTQKMASIREKILMRQSNIEMEIGGMGLANTYARMFLMYSEDVVFEMENRDGGFCITIGVRREGDFNVSGNGGGR